MMRDARESHPSFVFLEPGFSGRELFHRLPGGNEEGRTASWHGEQRSQRDNVAQL